MEREKSERAFSRLRLVAIMALCFLGYFLYRLFTVYTVRTGQCEFVNGDGLPKITGESPPRIPTSFPPRDATAASARPLVVMSYNIEGHAVLWRSWHIKGIADAINAAHPDIVGLQEVHRNTFGSRRHDQVAELARLTGMHAVFGKSYTPSGGEFGNAILTRGNILDTKIHQLPSVGEPRTMMESRIEIDGHQFNFFVTHFVTWGRLGRSSRLTQAQCAIEYVRRSTLPYIFVGDLNTTPDTPEVAILRNSNVLKFCGEPGDQTHRFTHQRIDYIFSDPGWQLRNARVLHVGTSDHWPIMAELGWTASPSDSQSPLEKSSQRF